MAIWRIILIAGFLGLASIGRGAPTTAAGPRESAGVSQKQPSPAVPSSDLRRFRQDREILVLRQALMAVRHYNEIGQKEMVQKIIDDLSKQYLSSDRKPDPARLGLLAEIFRAGGQEQQADKLAEAWREAFRTDKAYRESLSTQELLKLAQAMKRRKDASAVQEVAKQAETLLAERAGDKQPLPFSQLCDLLEIGVVAESRPLQEAARKAMAGKDNAILRKELAPVELVRYSEVLAKAKDTQAQKQLANFIVHDYLPTPGLAEAIQPNEWVELGRLIVSLGDAKAKKEMGETLLSRLKDGRLPLNRLPSASAGELSVLLDQLGVGDETVRELIVRQSLGLSEEAFSGLDKVTRKALLDGFGNPTAWQTAKEVLRQAASENRLPAAGYYAAARLAVAAADHKAAQEWWTGLLEKVTTDPKATMEDVALPGRIGGHPLLTREQGKALATKIASLDAPAANVPDSVYRELAELFPAVPMGWRAEGKTDPAKAVRWDAILSARMVDKDGRVNLAIAKTLAWYCHRAKYSRPFVGRIQRMRKAKKPLGDDGARWILAQAYAGGLVGEAPVRSSQANQGMIVALTTAQTPAVQVECLRELETACESNRGYAKAKQMLESVKGQLSGSVRQEAEKTLATLSAKQAACETENKQQTGDQTQKWYELFQRARYAERDYSMAGPPW